MRPIHAAVALCIVLAGVLLVAGCMTKPAAENQMSNITVAVTSAPTIIATTHIMPIPTMCPLPANGSFWIKINPISNVSMGNPVFINGTTNIPAGIYLDFLIGQQEYRSPPPHSEPPQVSGIVKIIKTESCANKFSFYSNTTVFVGPELFVSVWTKDKNFSGYNYPANSSVFYKISEVNP
jgi:hypothetical protein